VKTAYVSHLPPYLHDVTSGRGPANLATTRVAISAAIKDAGYLHIPDGRRDHTNPPETLRLHGYD
jgi:hypothetical protein